MSCKLVELLERTSAAGIVFFPRGAMLRPRLSGPVSPDIKTEVERAKPELLKFFAEAFDWHEFEAEHAPPV